MDRWSAMVGFVPVRLSLFPKLDPISGALHYNSAMLLV